MLFPTETALEDGFFRKAMVDASDLLVSAIIEASIQSDGTIQAMNAKFCSYGPRQTVYAEIEGVEENRFGLGGSVVSGNRQTLFGNFLFQGSKELVTTTTSRPGKLVKDG